MSIMRDHVRVHLIGSMMFAVSDSYATIVKQLKDADSPFMELGDYYDGSSLLVRKEDVRAVSQWTTKGCELYYEFESGVEEMEKEVKRQKGSFD